jgi:hypothetical protein
MNRTDLNTLVVCNKKLEFLDRVIKKAGEKMRMGAEFEICTDDRDIMQYIIEISTDLRTDILHYISEIKIDFNEVKI